MKKIFIISILLSAALFMKAQTLFEISIDSNHANGRVYKGLIGKKILQQDSTFKWYNDNQKGYEPDSQIVRTFSMNKQKLSFLIFGGTWCGDTQFILPRFFRLAEMAGIPDDAITLLGVDRKKESAGNLSATMGITNVPTIIVLVHGKETGRLVEYGKSGVWDKELADIIATAN